MRTIVVASRNSGSGKSMIAMNLAMAAAASGRALLVDTDPQRLLTWWWRVCRGDIPQLLECDMHELPDLLEAARREGVATVIIDTPAQAEASIANAVLQASFVMVPLRPAASDLLAAARTCNGVRALGRPAVAVLNGCPPEAGGREASVVRKARSVLGELGIAVARTTLGQRAAMAYALVSGRMVEPIEPSGTAAREVESLWRELSGTVVG